MFLGDDETPPNLFWPDDREALIEAVWRAGVATGRCLEVEDEVLRSRERISRLTHRDALADVKEEAS